VGGMPSPITAGGFISKLFRRNAVDQKSSSSIAMMGVVLGP